MYSRPQPLPLKEIAQQFKKKLEKIKLFISDVDGVLTNSEIFWIGGEAGWARKFNTQDGYGLKILKRNGVQVAILSGGDSKGLVERINNLQIDLYELGDENKSHGFNSIVKKTGLALEQILYVGDEFFDLPILEQVGFSATPPHSSIEIQEAVDYVTFREGGKGCVRELVDLVCYAQNIDLKSL